MKNRLEYAVFRLFSFLLCIAGFTVSRYFAYVIAAVFYYIIPIRKKVVLKNLDIAFPELPHSEKKKLSFAAYHSFAVSLVEFLLMPLLTREKIKHIVQSETIDLIRSKYEENNGVILMTAHYGNWEYSALGIGVLMNESLSIVVKNQRNPLVNDWMNRQREKFGNKLVPLGASIKNVYKELFEKRIIAMVADQRGPSEGIRMEFMGRETSIYPGPAALSLKTGAPILLGFMERQNNGSYIMNFREISKDDLPEDFEKAVVELSRRHISALEEQLRKRPADWLWMHNRWKY